MRMSFLSLMLIVTVLRPEAALGARQGRALACDVRTVALDTSLANTNVIIYSGRSVGQTFVTQDTLLQSIMIWRSAVRVVDNTPLRLYIMEVDSAGVPDDLHVLSSQLVTVIPPGDTVHSTLGIFTFSPPLALPHRGEFCFAIHDDLYCLDSEPFLASTANPYEEGQYWQFEANFDCSVGPVFSRLANSTDMLFSIDFCDTSTPIRSKTWGELKLKYR